MHAYIHTYAYTYIHQKVFQKIWWYMYPEKISSRSICTYAYFSLFDTCCFLFWRCGMTSPAHPPPRRKEDWERTKARGIDPWKKHRKSWGVLDFSFQSFRSLLWNMDMTQWLRGFTDLLYCSYYVDGDCQSLSLTLNSQTVDHDLATLFSDKQPWFRISIRVTPCCPGCLSAGVRKKLGAGCRWDDPRDSNESQHQLG